jgi:hypothetical protein
MGEGTAGQALAFHDMVLGVGKRQLEHILCQVNSDSRSMHGGLLS